MRNTIKKYQDFHTADSDPSARSAYFCIRAKNAKVSGDARIGFVAPKRTFKLATDRNRAKRLLRDWVRFCEDLMIPEYDYIFIAYSNILNAKRDDGRGAMAKALKYISQPYNKNVKQNS